MNDDDDDDNNYIGHDNYIFQEVIYVNIIDIKLCYSHTTRSISLTFQL